MREMRIFPVLCASALHNIGTDLILNFIVDNLPAPTEREALRRPWTARRPPGKITDARPVLRCTCSRPRPIRLPGRITYFKVISGVVKNDANLHNVRARHGRTPGAHRRPAWARRCSR